MTCLEPHPSLSLSLWQHGATMVMAGYGSRIGLSADKH